MTRSDLLNYWAAVAQVVPVFALAFVIEARMWVRHMSKKRAYKNRKQRVQVAATLAVTAFALVLSEFAALINLAADQDRALDSWDFFYFGVSFLAVIISASVVIWLPIADMVSASTRDVVLWVQFRLPWGKAQRLRRSIVQQIREVDEIRRDARSFRLDALMAAATALLGDQGDLEGAQKVLTEALDNENLSAPPDGELRKLAVSDYREPQWAYRVSRLMYDDLVARDQGLRDLGKEFRRQLRHIDRITDVNSPDFVKLQRANMAAAARMP